MQGITKELKKSINNEAGSKNCNEKTTFQIRIYDDNTGKVAYKYLTSLELLEILIILDNDLEWT